MTVNFCATIIPQFFAAFVLFVEVNAFFDSSTFQPFWNSTFHCTRHRATKPMAPTVAVKILEPAGNEAAGYWGMSSSIYAKDGVMGGDFFRCRKQKIGKKNPVQWGKDKNWEDLEVWMVSKAVYICFFQLKHRIQLPMGCVQAFVDACTSTQD